MIGCHSENEGVTTGTQLQAIVLTSTSRDFVKHQTVSGNSRVG